MKMDRTDVAEAAEVGRTGPRSVARALEILRALSGSNEGRPLGELLSALKLPKSSILDLLKSLDASGYVVSKNGRYVLGPEALSLAMSIAKLVRFPSMLVPALEGVAQAAGETALLASLTEDGTQISYLEVREGRRALRLHARPGDRVPANSVVVGQVILAYLPQVRRVEILNSLQFSKSKPHYLNRRDLEARLAVIRDQGYATGIGGYFEDVMGIAAPVFDRDGIVRCAIGVGGPVDRIRAHEEEVQDCVLAGAQEMSRLLGFEGHKPA